MTNWLFWIGVVVTGLGAFLLSPLADFLPVDFWGMLMGVFGSNRPSQFFRVVPSENSNVLEFALLGVGLVLVAASYYFKEAR